LRSAGSRSDRQPGHQEKLGRLRRQLDLVASGDYDPESASGAPSRATDEFAIMSSKVNLLGERLRGAQFEVSDLRGNIERLFQDLEDAVFFFNRDQHLVFASGSVQKLLGWTRSELAGHSLAEIFPPSSTLGLLIGDVAQGGKPIRNRRVPVTSEADIPAGVPIVLLSVDTVHAAPGGGSGLLVRLRDPEAQRKIGRQLQIADRLTAIGKISGGVAHEVKNPLNAILLHVEVARAKLAVGDTDVVPQMEIIAREILRLDRVVKTFLDFTRPVELNLANVPLDEFVRDLVDLARPQADASGIRVLEERKADGVEVRIDRDLLKQAVLNIVVNAIEAMPAGGELRLAVVFGFSGYLLPMDELSFFATKVGLEIPASVPVIGSAVANMLRGNGVYVDLNTTSRNLSKQMEYAGSLRIRNVLILGDKEREQGKVKFRNMETGVEELISIEEAIRKLKVQE